MSRGSISELGIAGDDGAARRFRNRPSATGNGVAGPGRIPGYFERYRGRGRTRAELVALLFFCFFSRYLHHLANSAPPFSSPTTYQKDGTPHKTRPADKL